MKNITQWEYLILENILKNELYWIERELIVVPQDTEEWLSSCMNGFPGTVTDEMRNNLHYCIEHLPDVYREIFYQRYRDNAIYKTIKKTVGAINIRDFEYDGIALLCNIEYLNILMYGIEDGIEKSKRVKEKIRIKITNKIHEFTDEELSYLSVRRSDLATREKNSLIRAGIGYFHDFLYLDNPLELKGIGVRQAENITAYIEKKFGIGS